MTNYNEMCAADLRQIARENGMPGAWKATKAAMIEFLESIEDEQEEADVIQEELEEIDDEVIDEVEEDDQDESENDSEEPAKKPRGDLYEWNGRTMNLSQWAKELGMPGQTLFARLKIANWSVEKAFTTPVKKRNKKKAY